MSTDLQDFAAKYTAAWCSQNAASVAAFYAPDGALTINEGAPACGRAAIAEAAQAFMTAFPDMRVSMDGLIVVDGRTEYHWFLEGTNSGPGGTGRRISLHGFEHWKLGADGLIADSQGHFDVGLYERQLGADTKQAEFEAG